MRIPRSNELDFLRLALATSVVFQHATGIAAINNTHASWIEQIPAVPLFILISGLLVTESYINSSSLNQYVGKRIRRILPAYLTTVLLGGLIIWIIGVILSLPGSGSASQLGFYYLYNLTFLNFLQPCVFEEAAFTDVIECAVNGSLWTIKFELLFYFILPLILFTIKKITKVFQFWISIALLACLTFISSIYLTIVICFIAGVLLSLSKELWLPKLTQLKITSTARVLAVFVVLISSGAFLPLPITAIAVLCASFAGTKDPKKDYNFIRYGDLSYGIYLVHFPLMQAIKYLGLSFLIPQILFAPLLTILSGFIAMLLYMHVEKRFLISGSHYKPSKPS